MVKIAKRKYKRRKISKKALIIAIILCLIIIIIILADSLKKIKENNNNNSNNEDNPTAQLGSSNITKDTDIYEKYDCKEITKQYVDGKLQIKLNFNKDLYTEDESNREYFESIIEDLSKIYKADFILLDEEKNIEIKVKKENDYQYTINSHENYFEKTEEKNIEIKNYKEIESINNEVSYKDFKKFDNNNWSVKAAGVEIKNKTEGVLDYGNYKILTDNIFINTIILGTDFKDEVIEGIKVGDSFNNIIQKLGTPTFEKTNMIGYKTDDIYIFFYNDEISIYPNIKFSNSKLQNLILDYINGEYQERKDFAFDIVHEFLDFKSYIDEKNNLNLESATRGIRMQIPENNKIEIKIYNNYDITEKTKKYIREDIITTNFDTDLIYETELNREK